MSDEVLYGFYSERAWRIGGMGSVYTLRRDPSVHVEVTYVTSNVREVDDVTVGHERRLYRWEDAMLVGLVGSFVCDSPSPPPLPPPRMPDRKHANSVWACM